MGDRSFATMMLCFLVSCALRDSWYGITPAHFVLLACQSVVLLIAVACLNKD